MSEILRIKIPLIVDNVNNKESLQKAVAIAIMENEGQFLPLLERLIDMGDARMTVTDGSLNIEPVDVEVSTTGGVASGSFDSDFYAGCKDINSQDGHEVTLDFEIEDGYLVFDIELPPAWRPGEYD